MIHTIFLAHLLFSSIVTELSPVTVQELEKRGIPYTTFDLSVAIDVAFSSADAGLFHAISKSLQSSELVETQGDQIIRLYAVHPNDEFKKAIAVDVALCLSNVDRIACSKYGCEFLRLATDILLDPKSNSCRWEAMFSLRQLARHCGFSTSPYFVKALIQLPSEENTLSLSLTRKLMGDKDLALRLKARFGVESPDLQGDFKFVTPEMAFLIYNKYKNGYAWEKEILPYKEKAQPYLSGSVPVANASLENVTKSLDDMIEKSVRDLCDKYKDVEPKPRPVPPPLPPGVIPERHP